MRVPLLIALVLGTPVLAQEAAPKASPRPVTAAQEEAQTPAPADEAETAAAADAPGQRDLLRLAPEDYAACLARLDDLGVTYRETTAIVPDDDKDCGILLPIEVSAIEPGVMIDPVATLRCPTAEALAIWTRDFVLPASARLQDRGPLVAIENGSGYICRRRNNAPDGKLSEHAFGNAFDVMGFRFADGPRIAIEPREAEGTMAESFQDAVRASACLDFSTVLGPGSNAMHADHLHLDIIARDSGYRLCEQGGANVD